MSELFALQEVAYMEESLGIKSDIQLSKFPAKLYDLLTDLLATHDKCRMALQEEELKRLRNGNENSR